MPDSNTIKSAVKLLGIIAKMIMVLIGIWFVYKMVTAPRHRAKTSMALHQFRNISKQLELYKADFGFYPPASEQSVYTFVSDELTSPLPAFPDRMTTDSSPAIIGPCTDAYRNLKIFEGEKSHKVTYRHPRDSEFFTTFRGYPLRYYRNAAGDMSVLISNGPDGDVDLDRELLDKVTSPTMFGMHAELTHFTYDPTNGSESNEESNGDLYRVLDGEVP